MTRSLFYSLLVALCTAFASCLHAQNVGDFILDERITTQGRVAQRYWPKGANKLWGTNGSSAPQSITLGSGFSLDAGVLNFSGGGGGGSGTVTSVTLTMPNIFSVSGSPVTTSGTLAATLANQNANLVFAGPASGGAATPAFRALVAADMPASVVLTSGSYSDPAWIASLAKSKVGLGSVENTALSTWAGSTSITTLGTISAGTVPAARVSGLAASATTDTTDAGNISAGTLDVARLHASVVLTSGSYSDPAWIASLAKSKVGLGSVENTALSTWAGSTSITTLGTISAGTVPVANVSGLAASATTDTTNAGNITSGTLGAARLPAPGVSTLGGVSRNTGSAGQFVNGINSSGELIYDTPAGGGGGSGTTPGYDAEPGTASVTGTTPGTVLSAAITPASDTKRVKITAMVHVGCSHTNSLVRVHVFRGSTEIGTGTTAGSRSTATSSTYVEGSNTNGWSVIPVLIALVDEPATGSSVTYTIRLSTDNGATTAYLNKSATDTDAIYTSRPLSTLLVEEIP